MQRIRKHSWIAMVLGGCLVTATAVLAADRSADEILKELDAVQMPTFDASKSRDQDAVRDFLTRRQEVSEKRAALILELYKAAPDHPRVPKLMAERWSSMPSFGPAGDALRKEIDDVLAHPPNDATKTEAAFMKARLLAFQRGGDTETSLDAVSAFTKLAPKDPRGAQLLYMLGRSVQGDEAKAKIEDRILDDYPETPYAGMIRGARRQREAIGQPFELEFNDAIKGSTISMADLKGKVVVIDFWATWCGPCIAEMPHMKKLYAKYRNQGVEFIGVSLDVPKEQGGLEKLKTYVAKNGIEWPQYYQGNGWDSEFSKSWGINAIPSMFVVDPDGKLYSVEARGHLETIIPNLLKKRGPNAGGE